MLWLTELYVKMINAFTAPDDEDEGATMVEYGLMVALIAVVVMTVVATLGTDIAAMFQKVVDKI